MVLLVILQCLLKGGFDVIAHFRQIVTCRGQCLNGGDLSGGLYPNIYKVVGWVGSRTRSKANFRAAHRVATSHGLDFCFQLKSPTSARAYNIMQRVFVARTFC
jgi:hypothetical protein